MIVMSNPYEQYPGNNPAPYGGQPYGMAPQEHPQATTVFVLGIVGIFVGICAPIAWVLGNRTLAEMRASGVQYSNESQVKTGRILGKVFTIIYIAAIVLYIIAIIAIVAMSAAGN
jgi:small-conductance mechanosensitive channel